MMCTSLQILAHFGQHPFLVLRQNSLMSNVSICILYKHTLAFKDNGFSNDVSEQSGFRPTCLGNQ